MLDEQGEAAIVAEREKVYGDPRASHEAIAMGWASLLQPWAKQIARLEPVPPHVVALMMASLKIHRSRHVFHEDNYDDAHVYLGFAEKWQRERDAGIAKGVK